MPAAIGAIISTRRATEVGGTGPGMLGTAAESGTVTTAPGWTRTAAGGAAGPSAGGCPLGRRLHGDLVGHAAKAPPGRLALAGLHAERHVAQRRLDGGPRRVHVRGDRPRDAAVAEELDGGHQGPGGEAGRDAAAGGQAGGEDEQSGRRAPADVDAPAHRYIFTSRSRLPMAARGTGSSVGGDWIIPQS
jgi:hypothetical protein